MAWKPDDRKSDPRRGYRRKPKLPPQVEALLLATRKARKKPTVPKTRSTDIERALKSCLMALRVPHQSQVRIGPYTVDFLVGTSLVLEADGYWHGVQKVRLHDLKRDLYLSNLGYRVVRLTYQDLTTNSMACVRAALGL
jgi:very-short-patch-repair endonuclease